MWILSEDSSGKGLIGEKAGDIVRNKIPKATQMTGTDSRD
jgi:hypothetical protein